MKDSAKYVKIVEWSEEDRCYVGTSPGLMLGGVHGDDEVRVYEELCQVIDEWIETKGEEYWRTHVAKKTHDAQMSRGAVHQYHMYGLFPIGDTVPRGGWWYHTDMETRMRWYGGPIGGGDTPEGRERIIRNKEVQYADMAKADFVIDQFALLAQLPDDFVACRRFGPGANLDRLVADHLGHFDRLELGQVQAQLLQLLPEPEFDLGRLLVAQTELVDNFVGGLDHFVRLPDLQQAGEVVANDFSRQPVRLENVAGGGIETGGVVPLVPFALPGSEALWKTDVAANDLRLLARVFSAPLRLMLGIAFLVGTLVVGLVIFIATVERQREYGTLKAVGARSTLLYRLVVVQALVSAVRPATRLPLVVKLSPNVTDVVSAAKAAVDGGADILSLINTLVGLSIDVESHEPKIGFTTGGLSGPAIRPIALRMVWEVRRALPAIPIFGIGGIETVEHVLEFLIAGANAVQVGTANFRDPGVSGRLVRDLGLWCERHGVARVADLSGLPFLREVPLKKVEAVLSVDRGEPVVAKGEGPEFREAVDQMVDRLTRMLKRHRSHKKDHHGPGITDPAATED